MRKGQLWQLVGSIGTAIGFGTLLWLVTLSLSPEAAAQPPVWPNISLQPVVTTGLTRAVHLTHAGDGSGRIFVVEQDGTIRIIQNGSLLGTPFLDISGRVRSPADSGLGGNEEGLLSVAFPPDYDSQGNNGHFYVYYTNLAGNNVIARFGLTSFSEADASSEQIILTISHPGEDNHNGGQLAFGPNDGYLYVGLGDGGGSNDPNNNGQTTSTLLGSLLRLDVETNDPLTYTIPAGNPFVGAAGLDEIWDYGLRNPWRFSFDRDTGDLYIGDVGQGSWEEISYHAAGTPGGLNFGWKICEGSHKRGQSEACNTPGLVDPIFDYARTGGNCSVTGGYVYRGAVYPSMQGVYFYADYCSSNIWGLQNQGGGWQNQPLDQGSDSITSFGEDEAGNLYLVYRNDGIYEIIADDPVLPAPDQAVSKQVTPATGAPGDTFTYTVTLTSSGPPLTQTTFLTDTLPGGLAYVPGTMTASFGTIDDSGPELLWNGQFNPTTTLQITYQVTATGILTGSQLNLVEASTAGFAPISTTATVIVDPLEFYFPIIFK